MTPCDICSSWRLLVTLAGCGGASKQTASAPRAAAAAELVNYQRNGGLAATLDTVSVRADGATRADKRYGGAGRRFDDFRLSATVDGAPARRRWSACRAARPPSAPASAWARPTSCATAGAPTWPSRAPCPPPCVAAVATLDAIADGGGRGGPVHHVTQAPA